MSEILTEPAQPREALNRSGLPAMPGAAVDVLVKPSGPAMPSARGCTAQPGGCAYPSCRCSLPLARTIT